MIPNMGPNRYAATVAPPAGQASQWVQTTTLEGGRDWDIWAQEGETGYDNEVTKGAELVPDGRLRLRPHASHDPAAQPAAPTGEVKGTVIAGLPYIGGNPGGLSVENGFPLTKNGGPINKPWLALSDLGGGDAAIYVGRGNADGTFDIKNVPRRQLPADDVGRRPRLHPLQLQRRRHRRRGDRRRATRPSSGWFTHMHGHVFVDSNENGKRDPGENSRPAVPDHGPRARQLD